MSAIHALQCMGREESSKIQQTACSITGRLETLCTSFLGLGGRGTREGTMRACLLFLPLQPNNHVSLGML